MRLVGGSITAPATPNAEVRPRFEDLSRPGGHMESEGVPFPGGLETIERPDASGVDREQPPLLGHTLELPGAQIRELDAASRDQVADGAGHDHLARAGRR